MKNTILVVSIGIALSACGGENGSPGAPLTNTPSPPDIGAAIDAANNASDTSTMTEATVPVIDEVLPEVTTDSQSLSVSNTFSFDTSRTVDVDFNLEQARNQLASVSICSSFDPEGGAFGVDYDSCTVHGQMIDGVFNHAMEVTNDIESVAAVVWFQNSSMQPIMQTFTVAHDDSTGSMKDRSVMSVSDAPKIVWR